MKIQHILLLLITVGLLYFIFSDVGNQYKTDFDNNALTAEDVNADSMYIFQSKVPIRKRDTLEQPNEFSGTYKSGNVILTTNNNGAIEVGEASISSLRNPETIDINLIKDKNLTDTININQRQINQVLAKLNSGFQINIKYEDEVDIEQVETNGEINTNTLCSKLDSLQEIVVNKVGMEERANSWKVYLFESSDFFNTANAVALKVRKEDNEVHNAILGNAYLLESPYLFAHELFHGLGLTHNNGMYNNCGSGSGYKLNNVMNESNIGCSRRLTARQIMIMNGKQYFPIVDGDLLFPEKGDCKCHFEGLGGHVEQYLNSFDRNLDDTPLIGDDDKLLDYIAKLQNDILPNSLELTIRENYKNEQAEAGITDADYVNNRIAGLKKLRLYNLARWIVENAEQKGIVANDDIWDMNSNQLGNLFFQYADATAALNCKEEQYKRCELKVGGYDLTELCVKDTLPMPLKNQESDAPRSDNKTINDIFSGFSTIVRNAMNDKPSKEEESIDQEDSGTGGNNPDGDKDEEPEQPNNPQSPNQPVKTKDSDKRKKKGN